MKNTRLKNVRLKNTKMRDAYMRSKDMHDLYCNDSPDVCSKDLHKIYKSSRACALRTEMTTMCYMGRAVLYHRR